MFKAFIKTIKFTFNVIVFSFFKGAINKVMPDKRLRVITSQNPSLKSGLRKIKVLKRPQTKSVKTIIFRFNNLKITNKAINLSVL
jgi:hypothetical protein